MTMPTTAMSAPRIINALPLAFLNQLYRPALRLGAAVCGFAGHPGWAAPAGTAGIVDRVGLEAPAGRLVAWVRTRILGMLPGMMVIAMGCLPVPGRLEASVVYFP